MKGIMVRRATFAATVAALALVAGCRSAEPEAPINETSNFIETANVMDLNAVDAAAPDTVTNAAPAPSNPGADFGNDSAQTIDDAEAAGMTSKLPDDDETQPVKE